MHCGKCRLWFDEMNSYIWDEPCAPCIRGTRQAREKKKTYFPPLPFAQTEFVPNDRSCYFS